MRILHILDHSLPLQSGYVYRTMGILQQQRALGWDTVHLTSPKQGVSEPGTDEVEGWRFHRAAMPKGGLVRRPIANEIALMQATRRRLEEAVAADKPDVLHAHSPVLNAIPALQVGRKHGLPVVYEVRAFWEDAAVDHGTSKEWGLRYRATRMLETHALRRADAVTTICEGLKTDIVARGIEEAKVTVIPNAVDVQKFRPSGEGDRTLADQLGVVGALVLGFAGSFYAYEGLPLLLQAMPAILKARPEVKILLLGGGPDEDKLKRLAQDLELQQQVIFVGRVPQEAVPAYYDLMHLLVFPRLSMRLTELVTPLKPLEAMAQERVVVASDVGGHRELITPGDTGYLFKAGDVDDLAATVLKALAEQDNWPRLRQCGRQFVEAERNWGASVSRYKKIYAGITGKPA